MSRALSTLSIDLEARLGRLEEGLAQAQRKTDAAMKKMSRSVLDFEDVTARVGAAFGTLIAADSVRRIAAAVGGVVNGFDAFNDAADATGATIEKLSALEEVGARTGTSFDTVTGILVKFNKVLGEAGNADSGAAKALAAIGLQAEELRRLDPAEALQRTARALAGYADDGNKARLVQDLFGKSVREAAPFLKDLAEAGELNGRVTREQAEAAERLNKSIFALQSSMQTVGRSIVSEFLPSLTKLFGELNDGIEVFGSFGQALVTIGLGSSPFASMGEQISTVREKLAELRTELAGLQDNIDKPNILGRAFGTGGLEVEAQRVRDAIEQQQKLLTYLERRQAQVAAQASYSNEARQPGLPSLRLPIAGAKGGGGRGRAERVDRSDPLGDFIEDLETFKRMQAELDREYSRGVEQRARDLERQLQQVEAFGEGLLLQTADLNAALLGDERARGEAQLAIDRQVLQKRLDMLGLFGTQRQELQDKLDANMAARQQALNESLKPEWQRMLADWSDTTKLMQKSFDDLMSGVLDRSSDALTQFVRTGKLNIDDLVEHVNRAIAQLIARKAIAELASIGDVLFGGGLGGGLAKGGVVSGGEIQAFATGGIVSRPTYFPMTHGRVGLMGEAGPEGVLPLKRGRDGRLGVQASGQVGGPTINVYLPMGVTRAELAAYVPTLKAEIASELVVRMRRPGFSGG